MEGMVRGTGKMIKGVKVRNLLKSLSRNYDEEHNFSVLVISELLKNAPKDATLSELSDFISKYHK